MKTNYEFEIWKKHTRKKNVIYNITMITGIVLMGLGIFLFNRNHPAFFLHLHNQYDIFIFNHVVKCAAGLMIFISPWMIVFAPLRKRRTRISEIGRITAEIKRIQKEIPQDEKKIQRLAEDESLLGTEINLCKQKKADCIELTVSHKIINVQRNLLETELFKKNERLESLWLIGDYLVEKSTVKEKKRKQINVLQ